MKRSTQIICCAVLSFAFGMMPTNATAQSDDDKKFLAMVCTVGPKRNCTEQTGRTEGHEPRCEGVRGKDDFGAHADDGQHEAVCRRMGPDAANGVPTPITKRSWISSMGCRAMIFDKAYMKDMVSDHTKALSAFTKEAKDTKDSKFRAAVIKGKTAVAAHKNMAYDLEKKL